MKKNIHNDNDDGQRYSWIISFINIVIIIIIVVVIVLEFGIIESMGDG